MCEGKKAISYFVNNKWIFKNDNFVDLCSFLRSEDLREFEYRHDFHFDLILAQRYTILGYRRFLMKQKDETLVESRKKYDRFVVLSKVLHYMFYIFVFYMIFIHYDLDGYLKKQKNSF